MSIETRREMLVRYLREHGRTSVNDLAAHFNITGATVRSVALKEYYRQMERALREELTKG